MKTMKWLLRREFWEHKGAMLWAPLAAAALIVVITASMFAYGISQGKLKGDVMVKFNSGKEATIAQMFDAVPAEKKAEIATEVSSGFIVSSAPLFVMMAIIIFFYCISTLSEERRDRSILFWKSLPVSDAETVISKAITALLVIPVITIATAVFMSVLLLMFAGLVASFHGIHMIGSVLSNGDFYLTPLRLLALLPVYIVWALPTIGWLLLVSSWAKSKTFLWAVLAPLLGMAIFKWANMILGTGLSADWVWQNVVARGLAGVIPGIWMPFAGLDRRIETDGPSAALGEFFTASWMSLGTPHAIIGAVVGIAMIYGAVRMRRWKDEG